MSNLFTKCFFLNYILIFYPIIITFNFALSFLNIENGKETYSWCLESKYNLLWGFNTAEMRIRSITDCIPISNKKLESDAIFDQTLEEIVKEIRFLRVPEFIIPISNDASLPIKQVAMNLFGIAYATTILESKRSSGQKVRKRNIKFKF